MFILPRITERADRKLGINTFTGIALLVHEVNRDGIFVHDTASEALHVSYNIMDSVSMAL
jgi:hypothetical protein